MTTEEQLQQWVDGKSIHNGPSRGEGECCPDFSCCNPGMQWPEEKRRQFLAADRQQRSAMCAGALGQLLDYHEIRKVKIIT